LIKRIAFLKSVVVVSSDGTNEKAVVTQARKQAKEIDAVENFKRAFNYDDPAKELTGIGFLIVCDMLLTGFDAPVEQVMYIDKKVKEHNLLQTIARVNRVYKGKSRGYIVDYVGLANHLKEALSIYSGDDKDDVENSLKNITTEVPILESRYQRLIHLFTDNGVADIEGFAKQTITDAQTTFEILELAIEKLKDVKPTEKSRRGTRPSTVQFAGRILCDVGFISFGTMGARGKKRASRPVSTRCSRLMLILAYSQSSEQRNRQHRSMPNSLATRRLRAVPVDRIVRVVPTV
jgi:hypothetical protein